MGVVATAGPTVRIGRNEVPVILPKLTDPRLHLASVIISIHVLGQTALGFAVSVPQILAAIGACAVLEVAVTLRRSGALVWPASAMLTGSGVALILRLVGTGRGEHWSWGGWYVFAGVAAASLATKYLIRYRDGHVFNPSNIGLVAAFVILGSDTVEPLDFWWAPFRGWMVFAYLIILVGGVLITHRLHLLPMAGAFWVTLAAGLAVLSARGHCMTTAWAIGPVCDWEFWWIVTSSPEVLIFLFFMITDPKTIPSGFSGRIGFAVGIAVVAVLLMAPQTTEFGSKVGLLAGLAVMSPFRPVFERRLGPSRVRSRLVPPEPAKAFGRGAALGATPVLLALAIVVLGAPAQESARAAVDVPMPETVVAIEPSSLPAVTIDEEVRALNSEVAASDGRNLALALAENLAVEGEARRRSDPSLLRTVDHGARLLALERLIERDAVEKQRVVPTYHFETLHLRAIYGAESQLGPSLGFDASGGVETVTYDEAGAEVARQVDPFRTTFVLNQATGNRWLIVDQVETP